MRPEEGIKMIRQTVFGFKIEKSKEALMALVARNRIPDPDTVGDWLRCMGEPQRDQAGLKGLGRVRDELNSRILRRDGTVDYTLDVDATQVLGEKREAHFTYQGEKGYMPMLGFLFESKVCLLDEFREGSVSPGAGHREFYRQCRDLVPEGKRLGFYRADSASYQAELINDLEGDGVIWAITADQDAAVKRLIGSIGPEEWREPAENFNKELKNGFGMEVFLSLVADAGTLELFHQIRRRCFELNMAPDG